MCWYDPIGISPNFKVDGSQIVLLIRIDFHIKMVHVKVQPSIAIYRTKVQNFVSKSVKFTPFLQKSKVWE